MEDRVSIGTFSMEELSLLKESIRHRISLEMSSNSSDYKILIGLYDRIDKSLEVYFPQLEG